MKCQDRNNDVSWNKYTRCTDKYALKCQTKDYPRYTKRMSTRKYSLPYNTCMNSCGSAILQQMRLMCCVTW